MKMNVTVGCKLVWYQRKGLSCNGNPCYYADFETPDGEILSGQTARDAACGYGVSNYASGKRFATVKWHQTRTGNIIFDFINDTKEGK
jgi:hypothetical protein